MSNSGARHFDKGDILLKDFLLECKTVSTPRGQVSIKKDWLEKAAEESFAMGKSAAILVFDFGDDEDYVVLKLTDLKTILKQIGAI